MVVAYTPIPPFPAAGEREKTRKRNYERVVEGEKVVTLRERRNFHLSSATISCSLSFVLWTYGLATQHSRPNHKRQRNLNS